MSFLRRLFGLSGSNYDLNALVSSRILEPLDLYQNGLHVFCDLDKTYLETEFESWLKMAKIPFESPHDKITVPGASEILELVRWGKEPKKSVAPTAGIHFVSSSPPQLRLALDGKLTLDRLEWSSDTFKNQSYNLRMARIDLLRNHIAYKTKAILDIATKLPEGSRIIMIGDNAEYDSFIYTAVRLFIEGLIDLSGIRSWLRGAQVDEHVISQVIDAKKVANRNLRVDGVFIRSVPGYKGVSIARFENSWFEFDHWMQIGWHMLLLGFIEPEAITTLVRIFHNFHGVPLAHLRWCLYEQSSREDLSPRMKSAISEALLTIGAIGQSGPSRRMLDWSFDVSRIRKIDLAMGFDPRKEASDWYHSIEHSRAARKKSKKNGK